MHDRLIMAKTSVKTESGKRPQEAALKLQTKLRTTSKRRWEIECIEAEYVETILDTDVTYEGAERQTRELYPYYAFSVTCLNNYRSSQREAGRRRRKIPSAMERTYRTNLGTKEKCQGHGRTAVLGEHATGDTAA